MLNRDRYDYSTPEKQSNQMWECKLTKKSDGIRAMTVQKRTKKDLVKFINLHKNSEVL